MIYAIYNYTCVKGEISIYTLSSLFIFLSTFWSVEMLFMTKKYLNNLYPENKPWWAKVYDTFMLKFACNIYSKVAFHVMMFVFVMLIPLVMRLNNKMSIQR